MHPGYVQGRGDIPAKEPALNHARTLHFFWIFWTCLTGLSLNADALATDAEPELSGERTHQLSSSVLNEERPFTVHLPPNYHDQPKSRFVVLYVLDGQKATEDTLHIAAYLQRRRQLPGLILVSIPHTGQRRRDYLPYLDGKPNPGANAFATFLAEELVPFIDQHYRTNQHRMLQGHSLAGAFVLFNLISHPNIFQSRFAFSPSLHHTPALISDIAAFCAANPTQKGHLYSAIGKREFEPIRQAFAKMERVFSTQGPQDLTVHHQVFDYDGHATTPFIGTYSALKARFAPWRLTLAEFKARAQTQSVVQYYRNLSDEFGFGIEPSADELQSFLRYFTLQDEDRPSANHALFLLEKYHHESLHPGNLAFLKVLSQPNDWATFVARKPYPERRFLNNLGYEFLRHQKVEQAVFIFQQNVALNPQQANVHDSLGEAYERKGLLSKARTCYQEAVRLARETADPDLAYYEANLHRLNAPPIRP